MADKATLAPIIFVTGVDGCGKTTLANWLNEQLRARGIDSRVVWSRFNNYLSKPLLALTRLSGHNYYRDINGEPFGFHDFDRLHGYKQLFALLQAIDVNIATRWHILRALGNDRMLVGERGPWDTLVDVMADTGMEGLGRSALGRFYTSPVRGCSRVLYVDRSLDNILATRPELADDHKMARKIALYGMLAEQENWPVIDNNQSLDAAKQQIAQILKLEQATSDE